MKALPLESLPWTAEDKIFVHEGMNVCKHMSCHCSQGFDAIQCRLNWYTQRPHILGRQHLPVHAYNAQLSCVIVYTVNAIIVGKDCDIWACIYLCMHASFSEPVWVHIRDHVYTCTNIPTLIRTSTRECKVRQGIFHRHVCLCIQWMQLVEFTYLRKHLKEHVCDVYISTCTIVPMHTCAYETDKNKAMLPYILRILTCIRPPKHPMLKHKTCETKEAEAVPAGFGHCFGWSTSRPKRDNE